jgi:hypothetical protein
MAAVAYVNFSTSVEFLWLNVVGAVTVFVVGIIISELAPSAPKVPR